MDAKAKQPQTSWVEVTGRQKARLATESIGTGQPFVWGHSLLGSMAQDLDGDVFAWRELTDIASVIRFDARGHGRSESSGHAEDYRWEHLAHSMWQVTDTYTDDRVVLGGASMGCATSLHAACQRPQQTSGLVLAIPPLAWALRENKRCNYRIIANIVCATRALPFRLLRWVPPANGNAGFRRNTLSVMADHLAQVHPKGVVGAFRGASLSDLPPKEELRKLTMPALILAWPDDTAHPLAVAEELHETLKESRLEVARHAEDPYGWPHLVGKFISSLN